MAEAAAERMDVTIHGRHSSCTAYTWKKNRLRTGCEISNEEEFFEQRKHSAKQSHLCNPVSDGDLVLAGGNGAC